MSARALLLLSALAAIPACDSPAPVDAPTTADAPELDAPGLDAGRDAPDAAGLDAPAVDVPALDAPEFDAPELDVPAMLDAPDLDGGVVDAPVPSDTPLPPDVPMPDVPPAPSVVSVAAGRIVTEGTGTTTTGSVLLTVSPASPVDATVRILTTPGTASSPGDYRFLSDTVSIPRGATSVMAPFEVVADDVDELDEQFEVMLIDPVGVTIGTATGTVTIADDDTADVSLRADGGFTVIEGSAAAPGRIEFTLYREPSPIDTTVVLGLRSAPGPDGAVIGSDVRPLTTATYRIPAGAGILILPIDLIGDAIGEREERFIVEILSVVGAELGLVRSLTLRIIDDDPPTISGCSTSSVLESSGGRFTFRVTSAIPMTAGVMLGYAYGGTAAVTSDYVRVSPTASTGSVPFPMGATEVTFTVDVRDDVTSEPTETVLLTLLSASGGATIDSSCTVSTLNIEDDD